METPALTTTHAVSAAKRDSERAASRSAILELCARSILGDAQNCIVFRSTEACACKPAQDNNTETKSAGIPHTCSEPGAKLNENHYQNAPKLKSCVKCQNVSTVDYDLVVRVETNKIHCV